MSDHYSSRLALSRCFVILLAATTLALAGELDTALPPIEQLKDLMPKASVFEAVKGMKPLEIRSADEAARHFDDKALVALKKQVDFKNQIVLVFAWKGPGQDKLEYKVLESFPEQVVFELTRGRTKDLRSHSQVFVLRSNVKWKL